MITGFYTFKNKDTVTIRFKRDVKVKRRLVGDKTILEIVPQ